MTAARRTLFAARIELFALGLLVCLMAAGCGGAPDAGKDSGKGAGTAGGLTNPAPKADVEVTLVPADAAKLQAVLDDLKSKKKAVFVDFWATWCGPCRQQFPHTVALGEKYKAKGLVIVTVALESDPASTDGALKFLKEQKADLTNLVSKVGTDEAFKEFDIPSESIPHYRVYDTSGQLVRRFEFGDPDNTFTEADIENAIRQAVGEAPAGK